jgi:hypothetical protein
MTQDTGSFLFQVFVGLTGLGILFQLDAIRRKGLKFIYSSGDDDERRDKLEPPSPTPDAPISQKVPRGAMLRVEQRDVPELNRRASDRIEGSPPKATREDLARDRRDAKMLPATFHYTDPPAWMLAHPMFETIWDEIKTWDVNVPTEYTGYCGATGNHAAAILLAIMDRFNFDGFDWEGAKMRIIQDRRGR